MEKATNVDEYIARFPLETRRKLAEMRSIIKKAAPLAAEMISYGIAAYKLNNAPIIYFAGFKNHIGLYPAPVNEPAFEKALSNYKTGRGSVQLPLDKALPQDLIKKILQFRLAENEKKGTIKQRLVKLKKPLPETEEEKLNAYMDGLDPSNRASVSLLRSILKKAVPSISERLKWNAPSYHVNQTDLFTFGPHKNGKVLLVFHHPAIVSIKSNLLEGLYKDRRLMTFADEADVISKKNELEKIVKALVRKAR